MIAADLKRGDRCEIGGLTHVVVQVIKQPDDLLRITFQCQDPGLIEAGDLIQGHATVYWLASYPVMASAAQHDRDVYRAKSDALDEAWQTRQDWLDKVSDHVGDSDE